MELRLNSGQCKMEARADFGKWSGDFSSTYQIAVFLLLLLLVTVLAVYGGLSQGAILSLLGFVPLFMPGIKKKRTKERYGMTVIEKIESSEDEIRMKSSVDETAISISDPITAKEQRRRKTSYFRVFSFFRRKQAPPNKIFTISGDISEMDDLKDGMSTDRKETKKEKERDPFSSLDQILLSLLKLGMLKRGSFT